MATNCSLKASSEKQNSLGSSTAQVQVAQRDSGISIHGGFPGLARQGLSWPCFEWVVGLNDLQRSLPNSISEILWFVWWQYLE